MSSRHSSHGESPRGGYTPSSASYHGQQGSRQQQYLHPEDVYRMDREASYFTNTSGSYAQSQHGSLGGSPRHSDIPAHQRVASQQHSPAMYNTYTYQEEMTDPFFSTARRVSPPQEISTSRQGASQSGSRQESPKDYAERKYSSHSSSPKGKGKEKERESSGESRKRSSASERHQSGDTSRRKPIGPAERLVSGVFIRY